MKKSSLWIIGICAMLSASGMSRPGSIGTPAPQPNIVHILTDDLGWQDVAAYYRAIRGKTSIYETPHMDRIVENGMRFMQAYSPAPTCAPSRAAYMSGRSTLRTGVLHVLGGWPTRARTPNHKYIDPAYSSRLALDAPTIARVLKAAGYTTGHIQKFHFGGLNHGYPGPLDYGFDFSWIAGAGNRYNDVELWNPADKKRANYNGLWSPMKPNRLKGFANSYDPTDLYALDAEDDDRPFDSVVDLAVRWMGKVYDDGQPFFLNLCPSFVHGPIGTRDRKRLAHYCEKMGIPFPKEPGKITGDHKEGQVNPYYAAMIDSVDWQVGKILEFLERTDDPRNPGHKLIENTYIMVSSDNGGALTGGTPTGNEVVADNHPLRGGKKSMFEGGLRIPFLIQGPGIEAGSVNNTPINLIDLLPTYAAMAGRADLSDLDVDGCNVLPLMLGEEKVARFTDGRPRDTMLYCFPIEHVGSSVIRKGDWKLILNHVPEMNGLPQVQLYRLYDAEGEMADIGETENLAGSHPEKAKVLREELEAWLAEHRAPVPYKNAQLRQPLPGAESVPAVTAKSSEGARIRVQVETGADKARIVEARLIYTTNGSNALRPNKNFEEWFEAPATVLPDGAEALAPPGMTHGIFYLRDANGFMVASEAMQPRIRPGSDIWAKGTEFIQDGYAYRPGLAALIELGHAARENAKQADPGLGGFTKALQKAEAVRQRPVEERAYVEAIRELRRAIKGLEVPEARHPVLNQFTLSKW